MPELSELPETDAAEAKEQPPANIKVRQKMTLALSTEEAQNVYRQRKCTVEPVFGQIKGSAGNPGMIGFLTRGIENCRAEWFLHCAVHNIGKLMRCGPRFQEADQPPRPKCVSNRVKLTNIGQIKLNMAGF
jgi:hypothetical protein